jgi:hypothetical protein
MNLFGTPGINRCLDYCCKKLGYFIAFGQMGGTLDDRQTGFFMNSRNDFIRMVAKTTGCSGPSMVCFFRESAGAKMNNISPLCFKYGCQLRDVVSRAATGEYASWFAITIRGKSLFVFEKAIQTACQGALVLVFFASDNGCSCHKDISFQTN